MGLLKAIKQNSKFARNFHFIQVKVTDQLLAIG